MPSPEDPTDPIRTKAAAFPEVAKGTSCTQSSFKTAKGAFLYIGPGPKGQGFKAMFKLEGSMAQARKLAQQQPERFEVGNTGWVTTRFTAEKPLPKTIWEKWLAESYSLASAAGEKTPARKKVAKKATKASARKKKAARGR